MKTAFILMTQYDGLAVIPVELVCRDYFRHLTVDKFLRKIQASDIVLPVVDGGVPIEDLAIYIDQRTQAARQELADQTERRDALDVTLKSVLAEPEPRVTVYIIGAGNFVKIGMTAGDVRLRMTNLATAHYEELRLLATLPNVPASLEFALQDRFAGLRVRGEWFLNEGELAYWIEGGCPLPDEATR